MRQVDRSQWDLILKSRCLNRALFLAWLGGFGLCGQNEFRDSRQQKISKILMVVTLRVGEGGGKSSCSSRLMPPGLVSSATVDTREGVELI